MKNTTKKKWREELYMTWMRATFEWRSPGLLCPEFNNMYMAEKLEEEKICALEQTWAEWQGLIPLSKAPR